MKNGPPEDKMIQGPQPLPPSRRHWVCPRCGRENNPRFAVCAQCSLRRPTKPAPSPDVEAKG